MSAKLPIEIRRNYTIKDDGDGWNVECDVCHEKWRLRKPEKGKKIHPGNVVHLVVHTATHPLPKEDNESEEQPAAAEVIPDPEPLPVLRVAHVTFPTARNPICYKVEVQGNAVTVSHFNDHGYQLHRNVQKHGEGHFVVLYAANKKHASIVGQRLIEEYKK